MIDEVRDSIGKSFPTENVNSGENGGGGNRTRATFPRGTPDFQAEIQLGHVELTVRRSGPHKNLELYDEAAWTWEPLDQAIPKLEALLAAAKLLQDAE